MAYVTIEAQIANGKVVPADGAQLPQSGRALITLLPDSPHQPNWAAVETSIGILRRPDLDSVAWQRQVRGEWDRD
jgi:hypothetical protein